MTVPNTTESLARLPYNLQTILRQRVAEAQVKLLIEWGAVEHANRPELEDLVASLIEKRQSGNMPTLEAMARSRVMRGFLSRISPSIGKFNAQSVTRINGIQRFLLRQGSEDANKLISSVYERTGLKPPAAVRTSLPRTVFERAITIIRGHLPILKVLTPNAALSGNSMMVVIAKGLRQGLSGDQIVRNALNDGLMSGLNHTLNVTDNQALRAYRQGKLEAMRQHPGVVGFRRISRRTFNVCPMCVALDGKIYQTDELMEVHPSDQCEMLPIIKNAEDLWDDLGSGEKWLSQQSAGIQAQVLGPRLAVWQDGRSLDSMFTVEENNWGKTPRLVSLSDLKPKRG